MDSATGRPEESAPDGNGGIAQARKCYDLEDRTYEFARRVRAWVKWVPHTLSNLEDLPQVVRSSGSVGANYIEAREALSKKDFLYRVKICRKESKETRYWLRLIDTGNRQESDVERKALIQEATELMRIFGATVRTTESGMVLKCWITIILVSFAVSVWFGLRNSIFGL